MTQKKQIKQEGEKMPAFDDVLRRMLNTPPQPRVKPKPKAKTTKKKAR
jgi:hypothetical protein